METLYKKALELIPSIGDSDKIVLFLNIFITNLICDLLYKSHNHSLTKSRLYYHNIVDFIHSDKIYDMFIGCFSDRYDIDANKYDMIIDSCIHKLSPINLSETAKAFLNNVIDDTLSRILTTASIISHDKFIILPDIKLAILLTVPYSLNSRLLEESSHDYTVAKE